MPYQENIPQATDQIRISQGDILGNFQEVDTYLNVDHEVFNGVDQGKHKYVHFNERVVNPASNADEIAIFSYESPYSGETEVRHRRENNGAVTEWTSALHGVNGWTYLPSGILLKWGQGNTNPVGAETTTFPVAATIPVFNNVYNIQLSVLDAIPADEDLAVRLLSYTATDFDVWGSHRTSVGVLTVIFNYLAIGD